MKTILPLLGVFLLLTGCASKRTLYYWGNYESVVYASYNRPDKADPLLAIAKLEEDQQKAASKDQAMGPGFHAHLGYLYFNTGNYDRALEEFEAEKKQFPESTVFMDRLIANLKK